MKELIIYVHGKGGNADEAEHYKQLFTAIESFRNTRNIWMES